MIYYAFFFYLFSEWIQDRYKPVIVIFVYKLYLKRISVQGIHK